MNNIAHADYEDAMLAHALELSRQEAVASAAAAAAAASSSSSVSINDDNDDDDVNMELSRAIEESCRQTAAAATAPLTSSSDELALQQALRESAEQATQDYFLKCKQQQQQQQQQRQVDDNEIDVDEHDALLQSQLQESIRQASIEKLVQQTQADAELAADIMYSETLLQSTEQEHLRQSLSKQTTQITSATLSQLQQQQERHAGAWDCPNCTYRNIIPYTISCQACHQTAPSHVLTFGTLPPYRFGVELELIVTNGKADGYSYKWLAQELTKLGVPPMFEGYSHAVSTTHWKIVPDASLSSNSQHDLCCELVSPILQPNQNSATTTTTTSTTAGLENMRFLLESVRRLGIAINASCGFHVHVDASQFSLQQLQNIANGYCALERAFDCLVARDAQAHAVNRCTNRHEYCRSNRLAFQANSNKQRWNRIVSTQSVRQLVELINPGQDRYRKLNFTNLISRRSGGKTIEFRQHGGVQELLAAEAWVRLILRFCQAAVSSSSSSSSNSRYASMLARCLLPQHAAEADELRVLFALVDCPGLEAYYMLERRLFPVTTPSSAGGSSGSTCTQRRSRTRVTKEWKCDECGRHFRNSQSLSQHGRDTGHLMQY